MKFKSILKGALLAMSCVALLTACGKSKESKITIAVPNDTTNEARALLLLDEQGYIVLDKDVGITATVKDIKDNPYGIEFKEVEAAQLPNVLPDVDYAVINSNYALGAEIIDKALKFEGSSSAYSNIVTVKEGNEETDKTKALVAALKSQKVADFINKEYNKSVISVVDEPGNGFDDSVNYDKLKGEKIVVAASPTPHAEILKGAQEILKEKDVTLEIKEYTDYVIPNNVVESGEVDANYFHHQPYLDDFNKENNTHIVSVASIHVEPMGIYGGKKDNLNQIVKK